MMFTSPLRRQKRKKRGALDSIAGAIATHCGIAANLGFRGEPASMQRRGASVAVQKAVGAELPSRLWPTPRSQRQGSWRCVASGNRLTPELLAAGWRRRVAFGLGFGPCKGRPKGGELLTAVLFHVWTELDANANEVPLTAGRLPTGTLHSRKPPGAKGRCASRAQRLFFSRVCGVRRWRKDVLLLSDVKQPSGGSPS